MSPPFSAYVEYSLAQLAEPANAPVRRSTLIGIRSGILEASIAEALDGDREALLMYKEYEKDLKALLVALEQRDTYELLYKQLRQEREQELEQRAADNKASGFCMHCKHCKSQFFD